MNGPVDLTTTDPEVWALTDDAVAEASRAGKDKVALVIRCRDCGRPLAWVGATRPGLLFLSSWTVRPPAYVDQSTRLAQILGLRAVTSSGPPIDRPDRTGTIALLGVEPVPALMVRCWEHGDLVLDGAETRRRALAPRGRVARHDWRVRPSLPRLDYHEPRRPTAVTARHSQDRFG